MQYIMDFQEKISVCRVIEVDSEITFYNQGGLTLFALILPFRNIFHIHDDLLTNQAKDIIEWIHFMSMWNACQQN